MSGLLKNLRQASRLSSLIELRADGVTDFNFNSLLKIRKILPHLIFTCRPRWAGGYYHGSEKNRQALLQTVINSGYFDYVDIEYEVANHIRRGKSKIIISSHNFSRTPNLSSLKTLHKIIAVQHPDIVKIVTYVHSLSDNRRIFQLAQHILGKTSFIVFGMGEMGIISRILYKRFGSFLTYATLRRSQTTAPGQLPYAELKYIYRADQLNRSTKIYGLLGNPLEHSLSPVLFNHLFQRNHLNAVYLPFETESLKDFQRIAHFLKVQGYSITMPFKQQIMKRLPRCTPEAKAVGAVNTIYRMGRKSLVGANTDVIGAMKALEPALRRVKYQNKIALILGAGGVARAIAFRLKRIGIRILVTSRNFQKARQFARDFDGETIDWRYLFHFSRPMDILINATPIGMAPHLNRMPVSSKLLRKGLVVFDAVYNPSMTRLLREAKRKGCITVSGLDMFLYQLTAQFSLFR